MSTLTQQPVAWKSRARSKLWASCPARTQNPGRICRGFCLTDIRVANSDENVKARQRLAGLFALRERAYSFAVLGVAAGAGVAAAAGALSVVVVTGAGVAAGPLPL